MASAQSPDQSTPPPPPSGTVLHTGTQLVVVDVVVQDKQGRPIRGLTRDNFRIAEDKDPQALRAFEPHSAASPTTAVPAPKLPPNTFTNFTSIKPGGALTVILLDALDTPMTEQSYLQDQLKKYLNKAQPGSRIAIFGLNEHLYMLQGFTSDPQALRDAANRKLNPRASMLLDDASGAHQDTTSPAEQAAGLGIDSNFTRNLALFDADVATGQAITANHASLFALSELGHYLSAFPGRKNVIWMAATFPNDIVPDATTGQLQVLTTVNDDLRNTTEQLERAQIALYPVDVHGTATQPMFDTSIQGSKYAVQGGGGAMLADSTSFGTDEGIQKQNMNQIAADTGGRAFYNNNDLASIVNNVVETGSDYYTLAYNPPARNPRGEFHHIRVDLQSIDAPGSHLYYRHGYYARVGTSANVTAASAGDLAPIGRSRAAQTYSQQSMARGAPEPQDVIFTVHAAPLPGAPSPQPVSTNRLNPDGSFKGPYRTFNLDFAIGAQRLNLPLGKDGKRHGEVEFAVFVYNKDGKLLASQGQTIKLGITPDIYNQLLRTGVQMRQQVSTPVRGNFSLRAGVHDVTNGNVGALEIDGTAIRSSTFETTTIVGQGSLR